ncbi:pantetheine-phosphate adenylyltransferase [Magnetospira thiophila]
MNELVGLYPGTFDPLTNGHFDIICRAGRVVDRLIIAVAVNAGKGPLFSLEERVAMLEAQLDECSHKIQARLEVRPFDILLMDFAVQCGAKVIIRGLRAVSDFEYEFQMAGMNARLNPNVETLFLMASENNQFISSRFVKEIGQLGGNITHFVAPRVAIALQERFAADKAAGKS